MIRKDFNEIFKSTLVIQLKHDLKQNVENKQKFEYYKFRIKSDHDNATSDSIFIRKFITKIGRLRVWDDYTSNDMSKLISTLSTSNIKVIFTIVDYCALSFKSIINIS